MKKTVKKTLIATLSLFACSMMFLVGDNQIDTKTASAAAPDTFVMEVGASVKDGNDETSGMSFGVKVTEGTNATIKFAIAPKNYVTIHDLTAENLFGDGAKYFMDDNVIDGTLTDGKLEIWSVDGVKYKTEGGFDYYRASVVDFGQSKLDDSAYTADLLREFVGRAYYIEDDATTPTMADYYGNDVANNTRSMAVVAQLALKANDAEITDKMAFSNIYLTNGVKATATTLTTEYYKNDVKQTEDTSVAAPTTMGEATVAPTANKYDGYANPTVTYSAAPNNGFLAKVNYTPVEYTITFDGEAAGKYTIEDDTVTLTEGEKAENTFVGWWDGSAYATEITKGSFGDKTFTGVYVPTALELYTVANHGGQNYKNSETFAYNGLESVAVAGERLSVDESTVESVSYGEDTATLSFTNGETAEIAVTVKRPVWIAEEIELFDATKGVGMNGVKTGVSETATPFTIASVFGDADLTGFAVKAESVEDTPVEKTEGLAYADGALTGIPVNGKAKVKQTVTFLSETVGYQVTLTPYTNVITTIAEFESQFTGGTSTSAKDNNGYYTLGNDITSGYEAITHQYSGTTPYDTLSGTFDGNGRKIKGFFCEYFGLFGNMHGKLQNVFLEISINGYGNVRFTLLGNFNASSEVSNVYIKASSKEKTNATAQLQGLAYKGGGDAKLNNVVMDTTGLQFKDSKPGTGEAWENDWKWFNPYTTNYDIFSTNGSAATNLTKLTEKQTNVYFVTEQYLSQFSLGKNGEPHAIIDAGNRKEGWTYNSKYTGGIAENQTETVFIDTFYRYDTAAAMAAETGAGEASDYADFTDTGLWAWDATNGLTWKGNADPVVA